MKFSFQKKDYAKIEKLNEVLLMCLIMKIKTPDRLYTLKQTFNAKIEKLNEVLLMYLIMKIKHHTVFIL